MEVTVLSGAAMACGAGGRTWPCGRPGPLLPAGLLFARFRFWEAAEAAAATLADAAAAAAAAAEGEFGGVLTILMYSKDGK